MGRIEINGDNNKVYNKIKKSRINSSDITNTNNSTWKWVGLASLAVAIISLIIKVIVSWSDIVQLFK